jgi:hypothetical protein
VVKEQNYNVNATKITGPRRHGPHAAAEAHNDRQTLCEANTSLANLQAAAAALKAAAAASETPAERNERAWKNIEPLTRWMLTKAASHSLLFPALPEGIFSKRVRAAFHNLLLLAVLWWKVWRRTQATQMLNSCVKC